jgi:LPXTG-motif cell wall-anchored protein
MMKKIFCILCIVAIFFISLTPALTAKAASGTYSAGLSVKSTVYPAETEKSLRFYPYTDDDTLTYKGKMTMRGNFKTWGEAIHLDKNNKIELIREAEIVTSGGVSAADISVEYSNDGIHFQTDTPSPANPYTWYRFTVNQEAQWDTTLQSVSVSVQARSTDKEALNEADFDQTTGHQAEVVYFATGRDDNLSSSSNLSSPPKVFFYNPKVYGQAFERVTTEHGIKTSWNEPSLNDPYVPGIQVVLYDKNNNEIGRTVTDQNGYYEFDKITKTNVYQTTFHDPNNRYYSSFAMRSSDPATTAPDDYAWYSFEGDSKTLSGIQYLYDSPQNKQLRKIEHSVEAETQDIYYRIGDTIPNLRAGITKAYDKFEGDLTQFRLFHSQDGYLFSPYSANINWNVAGVYPVKVGIRNMNAIFGYGNWDSSVADVSFNVIVTKSLPPEIEADSREVYIGENFDPMEGVRATDPDDGSDLTADVLVDDSAVDLRAVGKYPITYRVTDKDGDKGEKTVYISVRDFVIQAQDVKLQVGDAFNALDYATAMDSTDGDLTSHLGVKESNVDTHKAGTYQVTYAVTNSAGRMIEKTVDVIVQDKKVPPVDSEAPSIHARNVSLFVGDTYDPFLGVTASDKVDGDLTNAITIKQTDVDTSRAGVYHTTYQVENKAGKVATKTVQVIVSEKVAPLNPLTPEKVDPNTPNEKIDIVSVKAEVNKTAEANSKVVTSKEKLPQTGDFTGEKTVLAGLLIVFLAGILIRTKRLH